MNYYSESADNVLKQLCSNADTGLGSSTVQKLLKQYGKNEIAEKKQKTFFQRFLQQFKDVMIVILLTAAAVSLMVAVLEGNPREFFEPILILLIVIINAVIGVIQESKAEKAVDALRSLVNPNSRVIRDGKEIIIDSVEIVPGDIIRLEAGDVVPADARLIKSVNLRCDESALTGESLPSEKDADKLILENVPLGDRSTMIFSGCAVAYGTAIAVATATGMNTEMGKIANLLNGEVDTQTPLQKKLSKLGKYLGFLALGICSVIFAVGIINKMNFLEIFMIAVSLAVSAIPEGLPAIITVVLSVGVQRLAQKKAIIRKLPAVETLGSASVICSDKTGTLTQNKMTLTKVWLRGKTEEISDNNSDEVKELLTYATLCCDGKVTYENGREVLIGDPTETAIILAAYKSGISQQDITNKYKRIGEIPFDSERKLMTTVNMIDGKAVVIVKGAFDVLKERCVDKDLSDASKANDEMSSKALRVLAVAYKEIDMPYKKITSENTENNLELIGLVGMIDPPRQEAKESVKICLRAGIRPVMITGDHIITAKAIAGQIGIFQEGSEAVTGEELDYMSEEELDKRVENISVYARVTPENKIRIVKAWQKKGKIVSMTGDGVNDAPALKAADIGCAMGITGTDVAKGAADMMLSDDNFATIVDAIREGRGIYNNIKKVVGFLLGTNIGEVVTVFLAMLLWQKTPLLSIQLLWINLITDSLPAIALGMEPVPNDIMTHNPRPKNEGLFANGYAIRIVLLGIMFGLLSLTAFSIGEKLHGNISGGRTLAFMVLAMSQILQAFNMRSENSLLMTGIFTNKMLNRSATVSTILMIIVLFTPLGRLFGLVILSMKAYLIGVVLFLVPTFVMEMAKLIKSYRIVK